VERGERQPASSSRVGRSRVPPDLAGRAAHRRGDGGRSFLDRLSFECSSRTSVPAAAAVEATRTTGGDRQSACRSPTTGVLDRRVPTARSKRLARPSDAHHRRRSIACRAVSRSPPRRSATTKTARPYKGAGRRNSTSFVQAGGGSRSIRAPTPARIATGPSI